MKKSYAILCWNTVPHPTLMIKSNSSFTTRTAACHHWSCQPICHETHRSWRQLISYMSLNVLLATARAVATHPTSVIQTTTLSRRITMHLQSGAPDKHVTSTHNQPLTRRMMVENISVLTKCSNKQKLMILEAVYIRDRDPLINRQLDMRGTLSLYDGRPLLPRIWNVLWR